MCTDLLLWTFYTVRHNICILWMNIDWIYDQYKVCEHIQVDILYQLYYIYYTDADWGDMNKLYQRYSGPCQFFRWMGDMCISMSHPHDTENVVALSRVARVWHVALASLLSACWSHSSFLPLGPPPLPYTMSHHGPWHAAVIRGFVPPFFLSHCSICMLCKRQDCRWIRSTTIK